MHISHALEGGKKKKKPEAQIQPASLHKPCNFLPLLFKKKTQMKDPNLRSQKGLAFPFHGCFYQ
jgi:hypothetical protein